MGETFRELYKPRYARLAEIAEMMQAFNRLNRGLIARHYPRPGDIQLSSEFHPLSYEAFLENGCGFDQRRLVFCRCCTACCAPV